MKIFSDDGNMFNTIEEAQAHDERQRQHAEQKMARFKEVQEAHQVYTDLQKKYEDDYRGEQETEREALWRRFIELFE